MNKLFKTISSKINKYNFFIQVIVLSFLSFGLLIYWLGFYYDDWPFAWFAYRFGPLEFIKAFSYVRPFLAPFFILTTSLFDSQPWAWHVFGIFIRIALAFSVRWMLCQVWPHNERENSWVALLIAIFPGFGQQWVSLTHTNQELMPHIFQILSFGWMIRAARDPSQPRITTFVGMILAFLGIFPTEYFISLELLRPIFLWVITANENQRINNRIRKVFQLWLPYLSVLVLNIIWLFWYQNSSSYHSYRIISVKSFFENPASFLIENLEEFIRSLWLVGIEIWTSVFNLIKNPLGAISTYLIFGIVTICLIFLWFMIYKNEAFDKKTSGDQWAIRAMILGILGMILGKLPSWAIGLPISTQFPYDRLLLPMMFGSCLFVVGCIKYFISYRYKKQQIIIILLFSFAVGMNFYTANTYRRDWEQQKDFFWQLIWRIPSLKKDTILITHELPLKYVTDNSLSAALNWIYNPSNYTHDMNYMLVYSKARLGGPWLPDLDPDTVIKRSYRTLIFSGQVGKAVVFYYPVDGCLRVLDEVYNNKEAFQDKDYMLTDTIHLSDMSRIESEGSQAIPPRFIGKEPSHNWCYYLLKAELARQYQNWEKIIGLFYSTEELGYSAELPSEYMVFLEAFIQLGYFEKAEEILSKIEIDSTHSDSSLCYTLNRIKSNIDMESVNQVETWMDKIGCYQSN